MAMVRAGLFALVVAATVPALAAGPPLQASPPVVNEIHIVAANATAHLADRTPQPLQGVRGPRISPDGTRIIFAAVGDLWTVNVDPKAMTAGKPPRGQHLMKDAYIDYDPAWSADGNQLAFVSDRGGKPDIWLREMKSGKLSQLTTITEAVEGPAWSPDGNRIAFFKIPRAGDPAVRTLSVVTVFTGDVADIRTQVRSAPTVTWSPGGDVLALKARPDGASDAKILLVSLKGGADRWVIPDGGLTPDLARGDGPAWSPDGAKLAYVDAGRLYVVPVHPSGPHAGETTGAPRALTTDAADSPSWTGDSKTLLYVSVDRLKRLELDGTVKDVQPDLTWSRAIPDGRLVVWAGRLWDGVAQGYRDNVDIVIDGATITAIEPHTQRDSQVRVVNASHQTVIPGLIDSRVRLTSSFGERLGRTLLAYGVTSVRDWSDDIYDALERRESWSSGRRYGPREFILKVADGAPSEAAIADAKHLGYDLATSDGHGTALPALRVGVPDHPGEAMAMPQLAAQGGFAVRAIRDPAIMANPQLAALYQDDERDALTTWLATVKANVPAWEQRLTANQAALKAYVAGGGHVLVASDAPDVPYGLGYMVEDQLIQAAGLSPLQVLRAATSDAAASLGADKALGTVEAGKLADLAIVDGDPLARTADLAHIAGVVSDGHYYIINELLRR